MQEWLITFSAQYPYIVYGVIIFIALAEGPVLSILLGLLLRMGYFSFIPVYVCVIAGDLLGDTILYSLGYIYGYTITKKIGKFLGLTEEGIEKANVLFHKHKGKIIFFSKVTNGLGFGIVVLITAGITKIPFRKFMAINFLGQLVWSGVLIATGYFLGNLYIAVPSLLGKSCVIGFYLIIVSLVLFNHRKMRARFNRLSI